MTDAEWWACETPEPLLEAARGRASDRQLRLFACACARSVWGFVPEGPCREAVDVALRFADGQATPGELAAARAAAIPVAGRAGPHQAAAWAACESAHPSVLRAARTAAAEAREQMRRGSREAEAEEARAQAGFLRYNLGHPTENKRAGPARRLGLNPLVREIAEVLYAGGPQEDMAALADRLEALGCRDPDVVDHLRSDQLHVRGCWALDLLLGHETGPTYPDEPATQSAPAQPAPVERPRRPARLPLPGPAGRQPPAPLNVPAPGQPGRVDGLRAALAQFLSPKNYSKFLRQAVLRAPGPGRVGREDMWHNFARAHRDLDIRPEEAVEVCTVCTVHGARLLARAVRAPEEALDRLRDNRFLEVRRVRFPHAYPAETPPTGEEPERFLWWCPDCQRGRAEWAGVSFDPHPAPVSTPEPTQLPAYTTAPPAGGCLVHVTGPSRRASRVVEAAVARGVFAGARFEEGVSSVALRCPPAEATAVVADAAGPAGGPDPDPDLPAGCEVVEGGAAGEAQGDAG